MIVKYVGQSAVEVGRFIVEPGGTIDVPDDGPPGTVYGGRPPEPRLAAAMADLVAAITARDHHRAAALRTEIAGLDYGTGLLAQPENWQPAPSAKKAAEKAEEVSKS